MLVSFPLVFSECGICWMAPGLTWVAPLYYAVLIAAFQTGWATVQIAHLSLIPDLTPRQTERAELTAIRYWPTRLHHACTLHSKPALRPA